MQDLANLSNNPDKIYTPYLLFPKDFIIDDKVVVAVQVPLSSQIHKTKGHIFLRSEDGDYRVQDVSQLAGLLNRKMSLFSEQKAILNAKMEDLRPELFDRARKLMWAHNSQHPWADMSNEELLKIGGFYTEQDGQIYLNIAAILMFGTDLAIQRAVPAYKFDCLLKRNNEDRYDDRQMIYTNLIDAYDQMMSFVNKHLNDPFYLEGTQRISLRDKIFREAVSNIISHQEYVSGSPARLMIYKNKVIFDNPCTQHYFGEVKPDNFQPYSHNPIICKFMIQLGRFDELGSGIRNINKYLPFYSNGAKPVFREERQRFELEIPLINSTSRPEAQVEAAGEVAGEVTGEATGEVKTLLKSLQAEPLGRTTIQKVLKLKSQANFRERYLEPSLKAGLVEMTHPDSPKSPTQKYRLTAKGKQTLKNSNGI
ncbi:MAG: AAA family ATPase [Kiritimatiellae bacterium]|jgi:ATP-dependent DNA helicase RecG|nr:AAA family ATPase [Kiritimatiellia bacterium]